MVVGAEGWVTVVYNLCCCIMASQKATFIIRMQFHSNLILPSWHQPFGLDRGVAVS